MTAPAERATWFKLISVHLYNNVSDPNAFGDSIGVVTSWQLPGVFAGNPPDALVRVQTKIDSADWGKLMMRRAYAAVTASQTAR